MTKRDEPELISDIQEKAQLEGLSRKDSGSGVTLSGRCGTCGYLLGSPGHKITCGSG